MKKKSLSLFVSILFSLGLFAQDMITLKNGKDIESKILEVNVTDIKYKKQDNLEGPTHTILKSEVLMIRYANGTKDIMGEVKEKPEESYAKIDENPEENKTTFSPQYKNEISLSIGFSAPIGNYASNTGATAGGAGAGANLYLYYGLRLHKNIGLAFKWYGNSNTFDTKPIVNELQSTTGFQWDAEDVFWSGGGILGGVTFHVPTNDKFFIDFKLLGGYSWLSSPELIYNLTGTAEWVKTASASSSTIGYNLGTGFSYYFVPRINLKVGVDYIGGTYYYDRFITTNSIGDSFTSQGSYYDFGVLTGTLGLGINF